jgi:serine/threonine protein kinase
MDPVTQRNYEVIRQLGEGGAGRVYEAVHHPSGRVVAIKTLRAEHGGPASQRLLLNEAAAAAQLAHPSIVELIDVGRDQNGGMFLVMELVRGSSLEAWDAAFPGLGVVLGAVDEILDALATAHAQGIVHGDLKPANVLLTDAGRVKVTDFGIAHVIDPLRRLPERHGVQGTPYYMAPEQLIDVESIAPPTDLYALGVMLYELIAGHEPYPSDGTLGDMLARKMQPIKPLSPRSGLSIPRELASLVMTLLDPDPRLRPRFAASLRRDLADIAKRAPLPSRDELHASARTRGSISTWIESPLVSAPTISSSDELPRSMSTRSLPFTLPCTDAAPDVALHRLRPLPMLGRNEQAARLFELANQVVAGGGVRGVVVSGRAGEGKTRLLRHGFAEVERTGTMIGAAASFDETIVNAEVGLRACMRRLLGAPAETLGETLASRWKWLTRVEQKNVDFVRMHEWLLAGSRPLDPQAAAGVAAMCVLAASRVHPVYVWLDDVAWSRDGAMELMLQLLESTDARALVVGTLRSGTAEHPGVRAWLFRLASAGAHFEMLPPLQAKDRIALLEAAGPLAPEVAHALGETLDEPTLVLVETVRACIDEGLLTPGERGYVLREGASLDDLAAHARGSVLTRRIKTLLDVFGAESIDAERVLCHAALLGLRFEERTLRACDESRTHIVDRVLDRALLSGLLRVDGRGAYRFEHRLFLDVIVERCARRPDSADIFRATADALVRTYGAHNTDNGLAVAMLYRAGGARDAAVRHATETTRAFARASMFDAADRALSLLTSWVEADGLPQNHLHRGLVLRMHGVCEYFKLDYAQARKHLHAARDTFEACGAIDEVHAVLFDISSTHFYQDHFADAERCMQFVHDGPVESWALARAHHRLSELCGLRLDLGGAVTHQRLSVAADEDATDRQHYGIGIATLAELLVASGAVDEAVTEVNLLTTLALQTSDRHLTALSERTLASLDAGRGYYAAARARILPHVSQLISRGDTWHVTGDLALIALCEAALFEDANEVERATRAFIEAYAKVPHDEPYTWWAVRGTQAFLRGRRSERWERLAADLGRVLDARLEHIASAFEDDEPITEDADVRSDAARQASSR